MHDVCDFCENPEPWNSIGFCLECGKDFCKEHEDSHECSRINTRAIEHFNKQVGK
jgi:hypothetical protein